VAAFILRAIARRPDFKARIISLATSATDPCSLLLSNPGTWRRGVTSRAGHFHGQDFIHVGARLGELEFQRLSPRPELARLLEGCDLVQVVAGAPSWAGVVAGLGKPVVLQVATLTAVERRMRARMSGGPKALWRAAMTQIVAGLDEKALRTVDAVMVENPWMQAHSEAVARGHKTRVLYAPPGVDTELFRPVTVADSRPARPYVLAVGRFSDVRKNPLMLLEAYSQMRSRLQAMPDLVLAGADDPGPDFWNRAKRLGVRDQVSFQHRPSAEALAALFRNALSLAVPSDEEGFGIVVIEAMASAVPVVSTRSGGPDGIITDGVDGYLVDRDDAASMADRLCTIVEKPEAAHAMGRCALATIEARYADKVAGDVYLRLYDELLGLSA
jgi:glycosyltransferase involved in cell wall biosynthesis